MSNKRRGEIIDTAWKVTDSGSLKEGQEKSLTDILEDSESKECTCGDQIVISAGEILRSNNVPVNTFKEYINNALNDGHKKGVCMLAWICFVYKRYSIQITCNSLSAEAWWQPFTM